MHLQLYEIPGLRLQPFTRSTRIFSQGTSIYKSVDSLQISDIVEALPSNYNDLIQLLASLAIQAIDWVIKLEF